MATTNIYTIPESYRSTWDERMITAITEPSANLTDFFSVLPETTGKYVEMQTSGTLSIHRRTQRHEQKQWQEPKFGKRRAHPILFAATGSLSEDDLILEGKLPFSANTISTMLYEAAKPIPDRVALGVVVAGYETTDDGEKVFVQTLGGNCVIAPKGDKSPYKSATLNGQPEGLLGVNWTGENGTTAEEFPIQPMIGNVLADDYSDYSGGDASAVFALNMKDTNVIPVNYKGDETPADCGLTIEKIMAVKLILMNKFVLDLGEEFCMAITPQQAQDLMKLDKLQNGLYGFQLLKEGKLMTSLIGVRFLITPNVPLVDISDPDAETAKWVRACPVWRKSAAAFGVWDSPKTEVEKLSGYYDTYLVSVEFGYGSCRRRPNEILCVHCAEGQLSQYSSVKDPFTAPSEES